MYKIIKSFQDSVKIVETWTAACSRARTKNIAIDTEFNGPA